jgi:NitT/TauT family transport system ATP-binding protein
MAANAAPHRLQSPGEDSSTSPPALEVRGVSKVYYSSGTRDVTALTPVDLAIGSDELVALVGPSGCGKSTLLNIAAGLIAPTTGEVRFAGAKLRRPDRRIGIMFQSPVLFPWRTVRKNVELPAEISNTRSAASRKKVDEVLGLVGLDEFATVYPRQLSGGMQQRAALARVLAQEPRLMLMDEPFGALDEFTREAMNIELNRIVRDSRIAVVFVTHSIPEAVFMADRVVVMSPRPGRVVGILDVDFPKERTLDIMRDPRFTDLVFEARSLLSGT